MVSMDTPLSFSRLNEMYGHGGILRTYMGVLDERVRIAGQIQHGWSFGIGVEWNGPKPIYVWNNRSLSLAKKEGATEAHAIGSPYLYLPPSPELSDIGGRLALSLLAFPAHSTVGHPIADSYRFWNDYAEWLQLLQINYGLEQITVCLHANDYDDISVINALRRRGLIVATAGYPWSPWTTTTTFLDRLRAFILQHNVITSNSVNTSLFYAAYENKPVFVGGPTGKRAPAANTTEVYCSYTVERSWIEREFPGLYVEMGKASTHKDVSDRELGLVYKKSVAELWSTMNIGLDL